MSEEKPEEKEEPEEIEDEESFDLDEILKKKGYMTEEEFNKRIAKYEKRKTRAKPKDEKKEEKKEEKTETEKCPSCGGELKQTNQGWYKCQSCGRGYFIK